MLCEEAPAAVEDLTRLGVVFDADRDGRLALGLEGGHSVAPDRPRRRRRHGPAADPAAQRAGRRGPRDRGARGPPRGVAAGLGRPLPRGAPRRRPADRERRDGAGDRRRGRAVGADDEPAGRRRGRPAAGRRRRRRARRPRAGAVPPDRRSQRRTAPTASSSPRRSAARARGCSTRDGERFVDELAPRDEVARAIQRQMALTGASSVGLDMRDVDPALFPNVVEALRRAGIDPERELVPVAPAAHYMMGGIATDLDARSTLPGLYAVGECSCTGLHGANRLASNSLTECFVFGRARGARGAARAGARSGGAPGAPPAAAAAPPAPVAAEPRGAVAARRARARRRGAAGARGRPAPARAADRALGARADREPRRPPAPRLPALDPALDGHHVTHPRRGARARSLVLARRISARESPSFDVNGRLTVSASCASQAIGILAAIKRT